MSKPVVIREKTSLLYWKKGISVYWLSDTSLTNHPFLSVKIFGPNKFWIKCCPQASYAKCSCVAMCISLHGELDWESLCSLISLDNIFPDQCHNWCNLLNSRTSWSSSWSASTFGHKEEGTGRAGAASPISRFDCSFFAVTLSFVVSYFACRPIKLDHLQPVSAK